jgi:DNA mismatch endonuclease (patch repair protein)
MDVVSKTVRSRMMAGIRGKDTLPEIHVRKVLHNHGFRFRLHSKNLPGKPDIVLPRYRVCIFVHGCFWHRHPECRYATSPKTRPEFWTEKFRQNVERDKKNREALLHMGWRVIEIWECAIRKTGTDLEWLFEAIKNCTESYISWPRTIDKKSAVHSKHDT